MIKLGMPRQKKSNIFDMVPDQLIILNGIKLSIIEG